MQNEYARLISFSYIPRNNPNSGFSDLVVNTGMKQQELLVLKWVGQNLRL
jgi:hypothetical protein